MDDEIRASWDAKAADWDAWVGTEGDRNRRVSSDPALRRLLGPVEGLDVLDAGCGTGYLSVKLAQAGGRLTGVDHSPEMIRHARRNADAQGVSACFRVDSCAQLGTLPSDGFDRVVSNYVLMDLPDIEGAMRAMARVLRPDGFAVVVFLHPCFCPPGGAERLGGGAVRYTWPWPYLDRRRFDEEWGPFSSPFIGFHRPLSVYFSAIGAAGLTVRALQEPAAEAPAGLTAEQVERIRMTPLSVVLKITH